MLRLLSIRNFVVVEALELELAGGFSVLTGETGAGKSILLDALACCWATVSNCGSCGRAPSAPSSRRSSTSATAPTSARGSTRRISPRITSALLLRRTLDRDGRSRAWINGRPATLAQLKEIGERLVDLHGQHAHQSLTAPEVQRTLVDAFGGFTALARETATAWREWRAAVEKRDSAAQAARASAAERESLEARRRELATLDVSARRMAVALATAVAARARGHAARCGERRAKTP